MNDNKVIIQRCNSRKNPLFGKYCGDFIVTKTWLLNTNEMTNIYTNLQEKIAFLIYILGETINPGFTLADRILIS